MNRLPHLQPQLLLLLSLIWQLYLVAMASASDPVITHPPTDAYAMRGFALSLTCAATGDPKPRITWYTADNKRQVNSMSDNPVRGEIHLDTSGKLTFLNFDPKFEGRYYCNASNEHRSVVSEPVWARIAFLSDKFRSEPQSKSVPTESTIEIECDPPEGQPKPEVSWSKNGLPLNIDDRRLAVMDNGHLRILRASVSDAGEYACQARNLAGEQVSASAIISVKSKPVFVRAPTDVRVMQDDNATFNCMARGEPAPTLNWRKDRGQIVKSRSLSHSNGSLTIFNVLPSDAGKYICEASNSAGTNEAVATLSVRFRPEFVETPFDQVVAEGSRVVFRCRVVGDPKPNTFWSQGLGMYIFADTPPSSEEKLRGVSVGTDGSLIIDPVRPIHQGKYECHANSYAGTVQSSATLTVTARATLAPIIAVGPQSQSVPRGQDLQLNCEIDSDYRRANTRFQQRTIWYKNSEPIKHPTNRVHFNMDGSLRIYDLQPSDRGNYTCAISVGGETTKWPTPAVINVINQPTSSDDLNRRRPDVIDLPRPPRAIVVTDKGVDWVLLKVTPDTSSPAVLDGESPRYQVEYLSHDLGSGWQMFPHLFESETLKVEGLRSETSYQFLVRTVTSRGVSKPSALSPAVHTEAKTPDDQFRYSDIPQYLQKMRYSNFRLEVMKKDVVRVMWMVEAKKNTLELTHGFHVNYRAVPLRRCIDISQLTELDRNSHCSLKNEEQLINHLRSRTGKPGVGAASASSSSAAAYPDGLDGEESLSYARQQTATVNWRYNKDSQSANEVSVTLSDLKSFSCYEVTVENFNKQAMYGETSGSRSTPRTVLTWEYYPTKPPSGIRASWLSNTSLLLSWSPPPVTESNGILTGFNIHLLEPPPRPRRQPSASSPAPNSTLRQLQQPTWRTIRIANGSANTHVISGLDPMADYTLHLSAVNCFGEGTRSPALRIPSAVYSLSTRQEKTLLREPWFISVMVIAVLIWLAICGVVIYAFRARCLQRKKPYYKPYNKGVGGSGGVGCGSVDASGNAFPLLSKSSGAQDDSSNGSRFTGGLGHGSGHQLSGELHQQSPPPQSDLIEQQQTTMIGNNNINKKQQQQLFANSPMHLHHMQQQNPLLMLGPTAGDQLLPSAPLPPPATLPSVAPVATPYASASLIQSAIQQDRGRYQQGSLYSNADEPPSCSLQGSCSDCSEISGSTAAADHLQHQHHHRAPAGHVMTSSGGGGGILVNNFPSYKPPAMNICDFTPPPPPLSDLVSGNGSGSSRCPYYSADYQSQPQPQPQQQPQPMPCKSGSQSSESAAPSCYANCLPPPPQQLPAGANASANSKLINSANNNNSSSSCSPNFAHQMQSSATAATAVQQGRGLVQLHGFPVNFLQLHHHTAHRDSPAPSSLLGEADSNRSWPSNINCDLQQQQQQHLDEEDLLEDDDCEDEEDIDDDDDIDDVENVNERRPSCSSSSSSSDSSEDDRGGNQQRQTRPHQQQHQQQPHRPHQSSRHQPHFLQHHGTTPNYDRLFHSGGPAVSVGGGGGSGGGSASPLVGGPSSRKRRTRQQQQQQQQHNRPVSPYSTDSNYSALPSAPHRPYPKSERKKQLRSYGNAAGQSPGASAASAAAASTATGSRRPSVPRQTHPPLPPTPPVDLPIV